MLDGFFDYGLNRKEQQALIRGYAEHGFGFVSPPSQAFGISLSSVAFVCSQLERWPSLKLIGLHEAGWAGHQDVFACQRLRSPYPSRDVLVRPGTVGHSSPAPDRCPSKPNKADQRQPTN
jgi:hypothetical protein